MDDEDYKSGWEASGEVVLAIVNVTDTLLNLHKKIITYLYIYYPVLSSFNCLYIIITQQANNDIPKVTITIQKCCSMEALLDEFHRCVPPAGDKFHKKKIEMILKHRYRQTLSHSFIGSSSNGNYNIISLLFFGHILPLYTKTIQ